MTATPMKTAPNAHTNVSGNSTRPDTNTKSTGKITNKATSTATAKSEAKVVPTQQGATLVPLRDLKLSGTLPFTDVRGWRVSAGGGDVIGSVNQLVVEKGNDSIVPRYLTIDVDPKRMQGKPAGAHAVFVPVGLAKVDSKAQQVHLELTTPDGLASMPDASNGLPAWDREVAMAKSLGETTTVGSPRELYALKLFNPSALRQVAVKQ